MLNAKIASYLKPPAKYICHSHSSETANDTLPEKTSTSHPYRSAFMRDRDNILYNRAFFRLALKTQVITFGKNDHARNRMTHTLEVVQIARTISRELGLDEDLTEAIALGHDIGHTPFGHVGERTLNMLTNNCENASIGYEVGAGERGFKHNLNSMRILVESKSKSFTNFTLFGIANHSKMNWGEHCKGWENNNVCPTPTTSRRMCKNNGKTEVDYYDKYRKYYCIKDSDKVAWSFEAYVVCWADEIAQRHHDIEDAIALNLINVIDLKNKIEPIYDLYSNCDDFMKNDQKQAISEKWFALEKAVNNFNSTGFLADKDLAIDRFASFIVDAYVTYILEIFKHQINVFKTEYPFANGTVGVANDTEFDEKYKEVDHEHIQKMFIKFQEKPWECTTDKALACKEFENMDKNLQQTLMSLIVNSGDVQRLDGKAGYIIRNIAKAYLTNPQQLPDKPIIEAFNATIKALKTEIDRIKKDESAAVSRYAISKDPEDMESLRSIRIQLYTKEQEADYFYKLTKLPRDCKKIQPFEYRNALTSIRSDAAAFKLLRVNILRAATHHIANMTDRYAIEEHNKLY